MITLNKAEFGFFRGPGAQGMEVIHVDLSANEDEVDETKVIEVAEKELFNKLEEQLDEEIFDDALKGKYYTIFTIDHIDNLLSKTNKKLWEAFYGGMSKLSFDLQKATVGLSSNMNAWPVGLVTKPEYFTADEDFYQYFNLLFIELPIEVDDNYSPFALVEILRNPFTHLYCKCNSAKDVKDFVKNWKDVDELKTVPFSRINIFTKYENIKKVEKDVLDNKLRLCIEPPEDFGLKMI